MRINFQLVEQLYFFNKNKFIHFIIENNFFNTTTIDLKIVIEYIYIIGYLSKEKDFYAPDYPTWKEDGFIPLYTTPQTKPLSDEEIEEVMMKSGYGEVHRFVNPFDFARAIEERILGK